MLLVVLAVPRISADMIAPELMGTVAQLCGLAPVEVRQRLQGLMPRVLRMDADSDRLGQLAVKLNELGLSTGLCDPHLAPGDDERLVARRLEFLPDRLVAHANDVVSDVCPYDAIEMCQRANRVQDEMVAATTKVKKFSMGRAVMTGGLVMTKTTELNDARHVHKAERLIVVHRNDGGRDIAIYERHLDYRFLGAELQPVAMANLEATARKLQAAVPDVRWDARLLEPGYVGSFPQTAVDRVDLGLYLVRLAARAGAI